MIPRPALALCFVLATAANAQAPAATVQALPAEATVAGRGYPELAQAWWQWVMRKPDGMRPPQDPTGAQCHHGQEGEVWFLAGTSGTGPVERTCRVPAGKAIFLPVMVALEYSAPGHRRDCDALRAEAKAVADGFLVNRAELDGVALQTVRSNPGDCFDAFAEAQYDSLRPGIYAPAATDGLWLLLPPLPPGSHRLVVDARHPPEVPIRRRFDQRFTYLLEVGDGPVQEHEPQRDKASDVIAL